MAKSNEKCPGVEHKCLPLGPELWVLARPVLWVLARPVLLPSLRYLRDVIRSRRQMEACG